MATLAVAIGLFAGNTPYAGKPKLTVSLSSSTIVEGRSATGTVTHNNSNLSSPVTVTLRSSDTTEATVATTVTIPAGTNTANFTVTALNDGIADGPQAVTITTSATGYTSGTANVTVDDPILLPPVKYQVQFWTVSGATSVSDVYDTNNQSQTVGSCIVNNDGSATHAYLYDPNVDPEFAVDLNTIVSNIPIGWSIRKATAINNVGEIVAYIEPIGAPLSELQPILIDMNQTPPVMYAIPDRSFTSYSLPGDINDWGDIVVRYRRNDGTNGHYVYNFDPLSGINAPVDLGIVTSNSNHPHINNSRDIAGPDGDVDGYRLTWNGPDERFAGLVPRGLNEEGSFCGGATVKSGKGNSTINSAFIYSDSLELISGITGALDLNESRDVVQKHYLCHHDYGRLSVKDLLDPSDPDSSLIDSTTLLNIFTTTDRIVGTDFPVLTGYFQGDFGIQLVPVATP